MAAGNKNHKHHDDYQDADHALEITPLKLYARYLLLHVIPFFLTAF